jgi:hypothetical protein
MPRDLRPVADAIHFSFTLRFAGIPPARSASERSQQRTTEERWVSRDATGAGPAARTAGAALNTCVSKPAWNDHSGGCDSRYSSIIHPEYGTGSSLGVTSNGVGREASTDHQLDSSQIRSSNGMFMSAAC